MTMREICDVDRLDAGMAAKFEIISDDGQSIDVAVARDEEGSWHAVADKCSHGQVSLSEGEVEGCSIECWLHGSLFDLNSGQALGLPATTPIAVYPLEVVDGVVSVDVDA